GKGPEAGSGEPAGGSTLLAQIRNAEEEFSASLADDLNVSGAIGAVFRLVREINAALDRGSVSVKEVAAARGALDRFDGVLAVLDRTPPVLDEQIEELMRKRQEARDARNVADADRI